MAVPTQVERLEEIQALMAADNWDELGQILSGWPEPEIADLLLQVEHPERVLLFRSLPHKLAAQVFAYLEPQHQNRLLMDLANEDAQHLLADMSPDDRTALLEELPDETAQRLIRLLAPEDLAETRRLLAYPEDSVGRLMTPDFITVRPEWTIGQALEHIRREGSDSETLNLIYVTDEHGKLLDGLKLRRFIVADPSVLVESIMDYSFASLSAFEDREEAVKMIQRYDLFALPVVDAEGIMVGIVTVDDVLDVAEEEATEDFHKGAAVAPLDVVYNLATPWSLYRKRIGWLAALIIINLASSGVIAAYEETLANFIALAFFIPLLIDSGGNTGAQSATLMVRALATGDVGLGMWARTLLKEAVVGLLLGLTMGTLSFLLGIFRGGWEVGLVVGLTMLAIVVVANLIGTLFPFALTRFGVDPAVASSPLITSVADIVGLLIYFLIAGAILQQVA